MITPEEFIFKVIIKDYVSILKAIDEGFDINMQIPGKRPIVETAQTSEDYKMLHILWSAGAAASTPWLKKVFENFEKGIIPEKAKKELPDNAKRFNSNTFSVSKVNISYGELFMNKSGYKMELIIEPFELDNEIVETKICMENISMPDEITNLENKDFVFPEYPIVGYIDGSIYLKNIHNPITIKMISFQNYSNSNKTLKVKVKIVFDFSIIDLKNETVNIYSDLYIR